MDTVYLFDLINGISRALDYVSQTVTGHHRRVGLALSSVAEHLDLAPEDSSDLILAGLLHDIGAFSLDLKLDGLDFDADLTEHSMVGFRLLHGHPLLSRSAYLIKYHHTPWRDLLNNTDGVDEDTLFLGNMLNLMDRVDVLAKIGTRIFDREHIRNVISSYSNVIYSKQAIDAFLEVSKNDSFWERMEDTTSPIKDLVQCSYRDQCIPEDQLLDFSRFFSHIIDFRSRHTATHSQGVAETAVQLAKLAGMDEDEQQRMRLAGNLHDIGKLSVPLHLLDKPAALRPDEFASVKFHADVCEEILTSIPGLEEVAHWACQHHERLNGRGYPHGRGSDELSLGSRIMAVADVYTAITEDRPYREGMEPTEARNVLQSLSKAGSLDPDIVDLVIDNFEHIDAIRSIVQSKALNEFKRFRIT